MVGKRLTDTYVLDMYTGPAWEQLDDGAWGNNLVWLKQVGLLGVGPDFPAPRNWQWRHCWLRAYATFTV
jgi:hypothetical protein